MFASCVVPFSEAQCEDVSAEISGDSTDIIQNHVQFMANLNAFSVESRMKHSLNIPDEEGGVELEVYTVIWAKKPNYIRAEFRFDVSGIPELGFMNMRLELVSDGDRCILMYEGTFGKYYQIMHAPRNFWQIFDPTVWSRSRDLALIAQRFDSPAIITPNRLEDFLANVEEYAIEYEGMAEIDGRRMHGFKIDVARLDSKAGLESRGMFGGVEEIVCYLADGDEPYWVASKAMLSPFPGPITIMREWDTEVEFSVEDFGVDPPQGFRRVRSLVSVLEE